MTRGKHRRKKVRANFSFQVPSFMLRKPKKARSFFTALKGSRTFSIVLLLVAVLFGTSLIVISLKGISVSVKIKTP